MEWVFISAILLLSLLIYFTLRIDGFQNPPPKITEASFVTLAVIQDMYSYCTRILEEKKDVINDNIRTLRAITEKLRETIDTTKGDKDTIVYKHTHLEIFHLHILLDKVMKS